MAKISEITLGELGVILVDADPTVSGVSAPIGSLAVLYSGGATYGHWQKVGAGDTQWSDFLDDATAQTVAGIKTFSSILLASGGVRLGTTSDTTNGNIRYSGLDVEHYRDTWRNLSYPKLAYDEFLGTTVATSGVFGWVSTVATGGTAAFNTITGNNFNGLVRLGTGTTANATGTSTLQSSNGSNTVVLGGLPMTVEWRVRIPVLSNITTGFLATIGLQDTATLGDPTNGVYFSYTHSVNSGQWVGITRNASTSTSINSSIAITANTWYRLRMEVNAAASSVSFYIDSGSGMTFIGSSTVNITVNPMRLAIKINKTTTSATSSSIDADYVLVSQER